MTINLRNEFLKVLKTSGWDIYLRRQNSNGGYSQTLEIHTIRNNFGATSLATSAAQEEAEGAAITADNVFYFRHDALPVEGDLIYETYPNQADNKKMWKIDWAQPFRGFEGEIVYWAVGVTEEDY